MNQDVGQNAGRSQGSGGGALCVGYVMTHYPRLAQTFIAGEIEAVEAAGVAIRCFAMNPPDAGELTSPAARERAARTLYLKPSPLGALAALLALLIRHPAGVLSIAGKAVGSAGGNPVRSLRRIAHLVQAARLAREVKRQGIGHLHAHFGLAPATIAWLASLLASLDGRPVGFSFTIHGFHDFADAAEARLDLKARDATGVVCISDFTRSQLCLLTDAALWSKFHVLRCGVDLSQLTYRAPVPSDHELTILAVGRLSAEKGFALLIDAVARLRGQGAAVTLRLVGDGPLRATLRDAAQECGVADVVTFTGQLPPDEVREELRRADIFCLPSFSEGLPVSIMEAMATGVPVVTTWIAGIPELAENSATALTVPPARADALAEALRRLVDNPALRDDLSRNARLRVEALHSQLVNGTKMARMLQDLRA